MTETVTQVAPRGPYTLKDLEPYITGKMHLPNWEEVDIFKAANSIAGGYFHSLQPGRAIVPGSAGFHHVQHAVFFLDSIDNMSGGLGGGGIAFIYRDQYGLPPPGGPLVGRFAICKHEKVVGADANPRRGWHPGRCGKCGIDMTIDSGD